MASGGILIVIFRPPAMHIKVLQDTVVKTEPTQARVLPASKKANIKQGTYEINWSKPADKYHVLASTKDILFFGLHNIYFPIDYVQVEGNEPDNKPKDAYVAPETKITDLSRGRPIRIPKLGVVYLGEAILPGGHFSWAEATHNGGRKPANEQVVDGIIRIARVMEDVREILGGQPIRINSWYRDPETNRRVGGASRSRHLVGDAVDFVLPGTHPHAVNSKLDGWWGSRGGLASATVFTHIDERRYRARWSYGF